MSLREKAQKAKDSPDQNGYVSKEMIDYWDASEPDVILELLDLLEESRLIAEIVYSGRVPSYGDQKHTKHFLARLKDKLED